LTLITYKVIENVTYVEIFGQKFSRLVKILAGFHGKNRKGTNIRKNLDSFKILLFNKLRNANYYMATFERKKYGKNSVLTKSTTSCLSSVLNFVLTDRKLPFQERFAS
jgi:hypothetical protein